MQAEQVKSLYENGMSCEDIADSMKLDLALVKVMVGAPADEFSDEERAMAKSVITGIARGGMDISPREQLKAALYIHGGKEQNSNTSITVLQRLLLEAKQVHARYQRPQVVQVVDIK